MKRKTLHLKPDGCKRYNVSEHIFDNRFLRTVSVAFVLVSLLYIAFFSRVTYTSASSTTEGTSVDWLHTDGKYIKNKYGQTVFLRGVAFGDLASKFTIANIAYRFSQLMTLTSQMVNVVRCAISPAPSGDWSGWMHPEKFNQAVDQLVTQLIKYKVYAVIEMHGIRNSSVVSRLKTDSTPWIAWLLHFVNRYKNVPNIVGFEIWNEPASNLFTQAEWRILATKAYSAIRQANPNALIIVASVPFTSVNQNWIDHPLGPQAVYSWDSYYCKWPAYYRDPYNAGDYVTGKARMQKLLYNSKHINANLPILNTELGWLPTDNFQACKDYYALMNEAGNNWYTWWWQDNPNNYGLAKRSYNALTPHGVVMKSFLTKLSL